MAQLKTAVVIVMDMPELVSFGIRKEHAHNNLIASLADQPLVDFTPAAQRLRDSTGRHRLKEAVFQKAVMDTHSWAAKKTSASGLDAQ